MSINSQKTSCTRTMYLRKKRKEKKRYIISSLHPLKRNNTPPNIMIQKLTLPLRVTTLISKTTPPFCHTTPPFCHTTPPFCHEWQRVKCQVDISLVELASPSSSEASSSSPSSSFSASESEAIGWGGEGVGLGAKPPIVACCHAIRPTRTFTWYNSVESVSRRASMRYNCTMTSPKDTSPEEEGVDVDGVDWDGAKWEEGAAESVYRDRNWASLRLTIA